MAIADLSVQAGPWPRKEGDGFLALSLDSNAKDGSDQFLSVYLEYGLAGNRTIGIDRYQNETSIYKSILFLRWPIFEPRQSMRFSFELGAGLVDGQAALRPGLAFGKGLAFGQSSGWFSMETRAVLYEDLATSLLESDITFGWNTSDRLKAMFQIQAGLPMHRDPYLKLAPSLVYRHSETRSYTIGLTAGVVTYDDFNLNLGLWQEF